MCRRQPSSAPARTSAAAQERQQWNPVENSLDSGLGIRPRHLWHSLLEGNPTIIRRSNSDPTYCGFKSDPTRSRGWELRSVIPLNYVAPNNQLSQAALLPSPWMVQSASVGGQDGLPRCQLADRQAVLSHPQDPRLAARLSDEIGVALPQLLVPWRGIPFAIQASAHHRHRAHCLADVVRRWQLPLSAAGGASRGRDRLHAPKALGTTERLPDQVLLEHAPVLHSCYESVKSRCGSWAGCGRFRATACNDGFSRFRSSRVSRGH